MSPALLSAQAPDAHFETARIAAIAHRSSFLHGYLHGYEEGFHQADLDLQMGRIARGEYVRERVPNGYRGEFGSKHMYEAGYQKGFEVGFSDGVDGRTFRAIDNVIAATATTGTQNASAGGTFDDGMRSGYQAGRTQGLTDAREEAAQRPPSACPSHNAKNQQEFCAAFTGGYQLGYSDGFTNQAKKTLADANK